MQIKFLSGLPEYILRLADNLGGNTRFLVFILCILPFLLYGARAVIGGFPYPRIHDEFSYILAADTFSHGWFSAPPHPFAEHFEAIHVLVNPTYASKYPPGQGLFLAAGKLLFGHPYWGVILGLSFSYVATFFALRAWAGRAWGFIGSLVAMVSFGSGSYWALSYWGGSVCFGGAMLGLWALRELLTIPRPRSGWLLGLSWTVLFFTRPYEGGVLSAAIICFLVFRALHARQFFSARWLFPFAKAAVVFSVAVIFQAFLNQSVTGNMWTLPYMQYSRTYTSASLLWPLPFNQSAIEGGEDHRRQREWENEKAYYYQNRPAYRAFASRARSVVEHTKVWIPFLLIGLLPGTRVFMLLGGACLVSLSLEVWLFRHYMAPFLAVLWCCQFRAYHLLERIQWQGVRVGLAVSLCLVTLLVAYSAREGIGPWLWTRSVGLRQSMEERLLKTPGQDLVFVKRGPEYSVGTSYVYNDADIDSSNIVWAHDLGVEKNNALVSYYPVRRVWRLEPESVDSSGNRGVLTELIRDTALVGP